MTRPFANVRILDCDFVGGLVACAIVAARLQREQGVVATARHRGLGDRLGEDEHELVGVFAGGKGRQFRRHGVEVPKTDRGGFRQRVAP